MRSLALREKEKPTIHREWCYAWARHPTGVMDSMPLAYEVAVLLLCLARLAMCMCVCICVLKSIDLNLHAFLPFSKKILGDLMREFQTLLFSSHDKSGITESSLSS